jgi:4-alpha-glucanotransferase
MPLKRASGLLLHPTSLSGGHGIGDLGPSAYAFVDALVALQQRYWQVLPLGPTGYGDSPYQSFSAFAGNPLLIDLYQLREAGYLTDEDLADAPANADRVAYCDVVPFKNRILRAAHARFQAMENAEAMAQFWLFCEREASWLDDYALFAALKDAHGGAGWSTWEEELVKRSPDALAAARAAQQVAISFYQFCQWQFDLQWQALKAYANERDVAIIGDAPIFVAYDSADVWINQGEYFLDEKGAPTVVAGVPPDYFSKEGQLWGNPLYRWRVMEENGFRWWVARMRKARTLYDLIRIDHFRGFEAYWEVGAHEPNAINGRWVKGPDAALFQVLRDQLGELPFIAEDLGLITPAVEALRDAFDLPGMKIMQFGFSDPANAYLPHRFERNCVAYTGTHDNDTARAWFRQAAEAEQRYALDYLGTDEQGFTRALIRQAIASVADLAIIPVQDLLDLGVEGRMNTPAVPDGNWGWRLLPEQFKIAEHTDFAHWTECYGRNLATETITLPHADGDVVVHAV